MTALQSAVNATRQGRMMGLLEDLFPELRSITGPGLRATLHRIQEELPGLSIRSVPSGTPVFDWVIPPEWHLRGAFVDGPHGERVIDVRWNNLHVVNYSAPVRARMSLDELRPHLHSLPDRPAWIPYRTSYYERNWGFCLPHEWLERLEDGLYTVVIDSSFVDGYLDYGELVLPGEGDEEMLFSAHVCHPSLANDNLSGVVVLVELARMLAERPRRRLGYRFVFAPASIGAVAYLATHPELRGRVRHGVVVTGVGGPGVLHYKRTRDGAMVDDAMALVLGEHGDHRILPFSPDGYDERQYNSPGFRMPVGRLSRLPHEQYPEYHTSADVPSLLSGDALEGALAVLSALADTLERNGKLASAVPFGEPHLTRRRLTGRNLGGVSMGALLWVLNLSDGEHGLVEIARRSGHSLDELTSAMDLLFERGVLDWAGAGGAER